jgi:putative Ca2+/H+ antiporter (TMEM165/GDT1 family)
MLLWISTYMSIATAAILAAIVGTSTQMDFPEVSCTILAILFCIAAIVTLMEINRREQ